jgi:hypothetical protein
LPLQLAIGFVSRRAAGVEWPWRRWAHGGAGRRFVRRWPPGRTRGATIHRPSSRGPRGSSRDSARPCRPFEAATGPASPQNP